MAQPQRCSRVAAYELCPPVEHSPQLYQQQLMCAAANMCEMGVAGAAGLGSAPEVACGQLWLRGRGSVSPLYLSAMAASPWGEATAVPACNGGLVDE
eukprot:scaffold2447_cov16-Tisochrysis_lutea.AAC.1